MFVQLFTVPKKRRLHKRKIKCFSFSIRLQPSANCTQGNYLKSDTNETSFVTLTANLESQQWVIGQGGDMQTVSSCSMSLPEDGEQADIGFTKVSSGKFEVVGNVYCTYVYWIEINGTSACRKYTQNHWFKPFFYNNSGMIFLKSFRLQITVNGRKIGEQQIEQSMIHDSVQFLVVDPPGLRINHVQFAVSWR